MKKCPKCGIEYHDNNKEACVRCNALLIDSSGPQNQREPSNPEMMFCVGCGAEVRRKAVMCPACGVPIHKGGSTSPIAVISNDPAPGWAYFLTCCCTPIAGIILYLIWKDERPKAAKSILPCVIWSIVIYGIIIALVFLIGAIISMIGL